MLYVSDVPVHSRVLAEILPKITFSRDNSITLLRGGVLVERCVQIYEKKKEFNLF